jgi:transcriptional regulator
VYVPSHFAPESDAAVHEVLRRVGVGDLITPTARGLIATFLPLLHDPGADGEPGVLRGHVARNNPQWREPATGPALVIVRGPDGYVSPTWYASTAEHGRVVPTWNYVTAHVYGEFVVHDELAWVDRVVHDLTEKYEAGFDPRWHVEDAPPAYVAGQLRGIVGVELRITSIEAKFKLSQNRDDADVDGVIAGLTGTDDELARAMRRERDAVRSRRTDRR